MRLFYEEELRRKSYYEMYQIAKDEKLVERLKGRSEYARMKIYLGDIVKKINEKMLRKL